MKKNITEIPMSAWKMLPPQKGLCQECAADHAPEEPHKCESLYYQTSFRIKNDRYPTWADAMAHCSSEMKEAWTISLREMFQIDINSSNIYGSAK